MFRAVLHLGILPLDAPTLPARFADPDLDAEWDEESDTAGVYIGFDDGEIHIEANADGADYHFHDAEGEGVERSPWPAKDTDALVLWATRFAEHVLPLLPDLIGDAVDAAEWHHEGLTVYAREFGPVPLEIVDVEIEGEQLMLPWLGSGHVDHEHIEGENHPIALLWNPEHGTPDTPIAKAWLDPQTGEPRAQAERGVDWAAVGLYEAEVVSWVESLYLNQHVIADPASLILQAALERIAGIDH